MTQGNDGFTDPLSPPSADTSSDPSRDLSGDPLGDAWRDSWRDEWRDPRVDDVVRRSRHGEAVFTHGPAPTAPPDQAPPSPASPQVSPQAGADDADAADPTWTHSRELPVIEVSAPSLRPTAVRPPRGRADRVAPGRVQGRAAGR